MKRYNPGDPLRIPAADLNLVADFVEGVAPGMSSPGTGGALPPSAVRVRNMTGGTLPAFSVVALGAPRVLPATNTEAFMRCPVFAATIPDEGQTTGLAILQRKLAAGETGLAIVAGGSPVRATVTDADHQYAVPDGSGGLASAEGGPISLTWKASVGSSAWCFAVIGAASSAPMGDNDYYKGYFKLSISEKTRQVENPDYDPEDEDSPEYIDETYYEAHHSGGRYTINGQVGSMLGGDVAGDLSSSLQDIILHFHVNGGIEDQQPSGVSVELAPLGSNSLTDSYWLIGQASVDGVVQQSHGVPSLLWLGCEDEETATPEPAPEE